MASRGGMRALTSVLYHRTGLPRFFRDRDDFYAALATGVYTRKRPEGATARAAHRPRKFMCQRNQPPELSPERLTEHAAFAALIMQRRPSLTAEQALRLARQRDPDIGEQ